jgi:hypothetical protein
MVGVRAVNVAARAVGWSGASGTSCVYALSPSGTGILMNGSPHLTSQCGITIDSSGSSALLANGSPVIQDRYTGIVGGDLLNGSPSITPAPVTGIPPVSDPLSYLPKPAVATPCSGGGNYTANGGITHTVPGGSCTNVTINGASNNITLSPGTFGSVTINGASNTTTLGAGQYGNVVINGGGNTVTFSAGQYGSITDNGSSAEVFNAGTYVIAGPGGMLLNGASGSGGTGVTFYLGPNAGSITYNGSNSSNLTAPTTGTYAGILFFQDPGDTNSVVFNGSNNMILNGALYFPTAQVTMNGSNSSSSLYTILVANNLVLNGSDTFNDNYAALPNGASPIHTSVLVQ